MSPISPPPAQVERTLRLDPEDDATILRRLVAASIEDALALHGIDIPQWLADVEHLRQTVTHLVLLRRTAAPEPPTAAAREQISVAMLMVMPVYRDAQRALRRTLDHDPVLQALQQMLSDGDEGAVVDPWLHKSITSSVHDVIASRARPALYEGC